MTILEKRNSNKKIWMRSGSNVFTLDQKFIKIFNQYQNINSNHFNDIVENNFLDFDLIQDSIILKTSHGLSISKYIPDGNGQYIPYNDFPIFYKTDQNLFTNYWYSEKDKSLYTIYGGTSSYDNHNNVFNFIVSKYNLSTGKIVDFDTIFFNLSGDEIQNITSSNISRNVLNNSFNYTATIQFDFPPQTDSNILIMNFEYNNNVKVSEITLVTPNNSLIYNV